MNAAAFAALSKVYAVRSAGPINPPVILWQKAVSKFLRVSGFQGDFFFYSTQRLEVIAYEVHARCRPDAELDFFHGFTPWILTKPQRPYIAWSDCTFRDYIDIFHRRELFRRKDLERIEQAEATWLKNARRVGFRSHWAAERAVSHYALDVRRVDSLSSFGEVEIPARDAYAGGQEFAFVSTNFAAKGGRIVLLALRQVRKRHPDASLTIVGDQPSYMVADPGVTFAGFLRKEVPEEKKKLQEILAGARAVVHPTNSDVSPLIIVEAGYFGCPAISARRFAIPELVDDRRTGLLLADASQVDAVADAMNWMLDHDEEYHRMRQAAWVKAREEHSKQKFEEQLLSLVGEVASGEETAAG